MALGSLLNPWWAAAVAMTAYDDDDLCTAAYKIDVDDDISTIIL